MCAGLSDLFLENRARKRWRLPPGLFSGRSKELIFVCLCNFAGFAAPEPLDRLAFDLKVDRVDPDERRWSWAAETGDEIRGHDAAAFLTFALGMNRAGLTPRYEASPLGETYQVLRLLLSAEDPATRKAAVAEGERPRKRRSARFRSVDTSLDRSRK